MATLACDSIASPVLEVGIACVACGTNPDSHFGKISGTAGELGLGKLAILTVTTGSSDKNVSAKGLTIHYGEEPTSKLDSETSETCGKGTVTAP